MCGCILHAPQGDLACNPSIGPDWESNRQPFGSQASTQSTEPHQPGLPRFISKVSTQCQAPIPPSSLVKGQEEGSGFPPSFTSANTSPAPRMQGPRAMDAQMTPPVPTCQGIRVWAGGWRGKGGQLTASVASNLFSFLQAKL